MKASPLYMFCARHPTREAHWQCRGCGRLHCDDCVRRIPAGRRPIEACSYCDNVLIPVAVVVVPEKNEYTDVLKRLFSTDGLITIVALTIFFWVASFVGSFLLPLYFAGLGGYYFQVIQHVGWGRKGLPYSSLSDEILREILRAGVCWFMAMLPTFLWCLATGTTIDEIKHHLTAFWICLAIGLSYTPAAILSAVVTSCCRRFPGDLMQSRV